MFLNCCKVSISTYIVRIGKNVYNCLILDYIEMGTFLGVKVYLICKLNYEIAGRKLRFHTESIYHYCFYLMIYDTLN